MPGEDQERFEDYLELEHYIEELQAGHVAHPPTELTPSQARIYRMAALFRSASPEGAMPRPEFVAALQEQLEPELQQSAKTQPLPILRGKKRRLPLLQPNRVSRRALLTGGAVAAASMIVGAGIGHVAEQAVVGQSLAASSTPLIQDGLPTTWHFVTTVALLGKNAQRFTTDTIVGYVILGDEDADVQDRGKIIAMSAACTHMGCIIQWDSVGRKFLCPCHAGLFSEYGNVDNSSGPPSLYPLRRLETQVQDGNIYVKVPVCNMK